MALENVEKFESLLREDEGLQARLAAATKAYEGERTDEALFDELLAPIAAGVGLPFSFAEAREFASQARPLSDAELGAVAGGTSFCIIVGLGTGPEAEIEDGMDGGACAYIGIGVGFWGH